MRTLLATLLFEELRSSFTPEVVDEVLAEALAGDDSLDTRDGAALHAFAEGRLRAVLVARLGETDGHAVADRTCAMLAPHRDTRPPPPPQSEPGDESNAGADPLGIPSQSGEIRKRPKSDSIFPSIPDLDTPLRDAASIGILQSDAGIRPLVIRGVQSRGLTVVVLGSARTLERSPAAGWLDVFIVSSTLPSSEARDLARWVAQRPKPAAIVIWPAGREAPSFGHLLAGAVECPIADLEVLVDLVWQEVSRLRRRQSVAG